MIVVRKYKGRSGRSVFEWRVYSVITGPKIHNTQLGKFRTQEAAERAAEFHRQHAAAVAKRSAEYWQRWRARHMDGIEER